MWTSLSEIASRLWNKLDKFALTALQDKKVVPTTYTCFNERVTGKTMHQTSKCCNNCYHSLSSAYLSP
jgi:hypothetical protein